MVDIPALDPAAVRWSAPVAERAGRPLLVLLHGYGANEHDLFAFAPHLPDEFVVAAVRAPLLPPFPTPGHSWYPIEGLQNRRPEDVTAAAERLIQWLDAETDAASVGLLGFSQGASVALQALRLQPPGSLPGDAHLAEVRPPVFWGRGTHDDVIPPELIDHTVQWLPDHVDLSGRVYTGLAHSVSQQELDDVVVFLRKRLDAAAATS